MQKLEIKNFGPIKEYELQVNDFMVLIGPQASGKSTISKGVYFFKSLRDDLIKFVIELIEDKNIRKPLGTFAKIIRQKFLNFWGSTQHLDNIFLKYTYSEDVFIRISLEQKSKYADPFFSPGFKYGFSEIISEAKKFIEFSSTGNPASLSSSELLAIGSEKKMFYRKVENLANALFQDDRDIFFIPAGRSLLATLSDQLQFLQTNKMDYLMRAFVDRINNYKPIFNKSLSDIVFEKKKLTMDTIDFENIVLAQSIVKSILKGSYRCDSDGEKIFINVENYVKLNYSSSGQQEAIWILHLIFLFILENKKVFVVFEEPEAHLYPEAQKLMVELVCLLFNNRNQIIITSHSPYILASLNNLLYAAKIGRQKFDEVKKRINPKFWLDFDKLSALFIDQGKCESILDAELGLIMVEAIDSASQLINDEYDFLFNLEE